MDHLAPPLHRTLREGLSLPRVIFNPLRRAAKGELVGRGRPVLVIPGLATGDISTTLLRRTLAARGFVPEGWRQGLNTGAHPAKLKRIEQRLETLHEQAGEKVILIGWSLGGLYARVLGLRVPEHLAMVITVASPFSGDRRANRAWRLYEAINDHKVDNPPFTENPADKPPVPTVAIWSALDGVVAPARAGRRARRILRCVSMPRISRSALHRPVSRR